MKNFNSDKFLLYYMITAFVVILMIVALYGCRSYKGNYSQEAYQYNKKYSKQHKTK